MATVRDNKVETITQAIKQVIKNEQLSDYLQDYPWLTGYLGNPQSSVWFVGENPSRRGIESVSKRHIEHTENLQWNSHSGDELFRESLTEAGFKSGQPGENEGWDCYITNVIKEPEWVKERNEKKKDPKYWQVQALRWLPILQMQILSGNPKVLVAIGNQARKILVFMMNKGLVAPAVDMIPHYSYIMKRPDRKTKLGPGHPSRVRHFKNEILRIKDLYRG